jgi:hypothetical protein
VIIGIGLWSVKRDVVATSGESLCSVKRGFMFISGEGLGISGAGPRLKADKLNIPGGLSLEAARCLDGGGGGKAC